MTGRRLALLVFAALVVLALVAGYACPTGWTHIVAGWTWNSPVAGLGDGHLSRLCGLTCGG